MKYKILDYFQNTVNKTPNKVAIIEGDNHITFQDLEIKAKIFAKCLVNNLDEKNQPIAIYLPKSIQGIIANIAITYSANIFMHLDVKSPSERISNILSSIQPKLIITNSIYLKDLGNFSNKFITINIDEINFEEKIDTERNLYQRLEYIIDTDPYCIINTSGSTGTPKGVVLNHRSYINYTQWAINTFDFDESFRLGVLSPPIFDHYNYELCLMMMTGAELVLLDNNLALFPIKLLDLLLAHNVNYIFWVPTIMVNIANMDLLSSTQLPQLKMIWFAGEVFPTKQFNYWRKNLPNAKFVNLYGPTEATVDCTYYIVNRELSDDEPIPIGFQCRNTDILILDEDDKLSETGKEGELCIRGTSLAMGYYNNPEKTKQAFVQNPLNTAYPELIYRTGDIVAYNELEEIVFKGRKDTLIKHFGYRIELGEIEHVALSTVDLVRNVCCLYNHNKKEIVFVYENEVEISVVDWRKFFLKALPKYMIPTTYFKIDTMPRNVNGKIDRSLLNRMFC